MDAYYSLTAARSSGFGGAEPIQISEIVAYLDLVGILDRDERAKYLRHVQRLDNAYLTYAREKDAQARAAQKTLTR
jgi:hypothetical protein